MFWSRGNLRIAFAKQNGRRPFFADAPAANNRLVAKPQAASFFSSAFFASSHAGQ